MEAQDFYNMFGSWNIVRVVPQSDALLAVTVTNGERKVKTEVQREPQFTRKTIGLS